MRNAREMQEASERRESQAIRSVRVIFLFLNMLVLHIYKQTNTHLNTDIAQLISDVFFFGIQSCEYSTTTKGENKRTHILHKGDIQFLRKCHELPHDSGILHLADKVSPTFRTHKNGVKNATVTQYRTSTSLCQVRIWAEIIIRLDSYSGTTRDTPVNMVWVEHQNTKITSHMTTKSLRSGTL